ncbi:MAG: methyltransferase domain-containing protein [Geminocystis sp.]|nr:methyltransferase domain-containing protein [Geminocystis sp.]HIK37089.1 methyltransferase domain-containing protein [Geminocystis sp. M7585_C2015_104]MCS7148613.1 methyltransferase domain-containing protein [Geminocystis sp.]MCX8079387.1 methyltransferase domain-containing protein [Geminocystis sp.]MDW8114995.1 methyltransferase domain-containing protein [Geminocystis sp.]
MVTTKATGPMDWTSKLINSLLAIKPIHDWARGRARDMIVKRAYKIGVPWHERLKALKENNDWEKEMTQVVNERVKYPPYYLTSFHSYDKGNLEWDAAWELECASYSVHSTVYSKTPSIDGDRLLRSNYCQQLQKQLAYRPQKILDIGCGVGLSTFALSEAFPDSEITGLDLSPYFLAVASHQSRQKGKKIRWLHGAAEETGLPAESFDLVSAFLLFHELPQIAAKNIIREARRILRRGGYFAMMDMNPQSEVYKKMPRYVFTLLKSTEPYLDEYFTLDIESALMDAGFEKPTITPISVRHRVVVAKKL